MRNKFCSDLAPEHFAGVAIKAKDNKFKEGVGMGDAKDTLGLILRLGEGRIHLAGVDRREDEKLVAPDNRG